MKKVILHVGLLVAAFHLSDISSAQAADQVITGTGTTNYVPKYKGTYAVGNSQIVDTGTNVGIGTAAPKTKLHLYNSTSHAELRAETTFADSNHVPAISVKNPSTEWSFGLTDGTGLNIRENSAAYASRMFIKNGGNVGIGTTTPGVKLEVEGAGETRMRVDATSGSGSAVIELASGAITNFLFTDKVANGGHLVLRTDSARHVLFQAGGNTSGNVGIGTTAPSEKLQVNGNVKANAFLIGAAARQTSQIMPLDNASGRIDCLEGISYRAKDSKAGDDLQLGMVGEDVEACFPELVATDAQGEKAIDYARLVVPLVETAKEQQQIIRELEARLARIEARLK